MAIGASATSLTQSSPHRPDPAQPSKGFRIKKAANIAFVTLTVFFTVLTAISITFVVLGSIIFEAVAILSISSTIAGIGTIALCILGFLKAWEKITPHLPTCLRVRANYIQSLVCGFFTALVLTVIWPFDWTKKNIKPEKIDPNKPLLIAIHGFMGSSNNWIYHMKRLREAGHTNLATINLGNWFLSINDYVEKLHLMIVDYVKKAPLKDGQKLRIQFLCHSMGGLVARRYNELYHTIDGVEVEDIITLGTPLDGTWLAVFGRGSKAAEEMMPGSPFVKGLQSKAALEEKTRSYHLWSKSDWIIPMKSASQGGGKENMTKTDELHATGHVSFLLSDTAADKTIRYLKDVETLSRRHIEV